MEGQCVLNNNGIQFFSFVGTWKNSRSILSQFSGHLLHICAESDISLWINFKNLNLFGRKWSIRFRSLLCKCLGQIMLLQSRNAVSKFQNWSKWSVKAVVLSLLNHRCSSTGLHNALNSGTTLPWIWFPMNLLGVQMQALNICFLLFVCLCYRVIWRNSPNEF